MATSPARKSVEPAKKSMLTPIVDRATNVRTRAISKRAEAQKHTNEVGTFDDLVSNFRDVVAKISQPDIIYEIASTYGGTRYVVFGISRFNKKIDGNKAYLSIAARKLKDKPSSVFSASRILMFNVVITYNNIPRYIIEPKMAAARLLAAKLEIEDVDSLCRIVNGGSLIDLLELVPAEVEEERDAALKQIKRLVRDIDIKNHKVEQAARDNEDMKRKQSIVLGDISRMKDQILEVSNIRGSLEKRVRQLESAMTDAGMQIPPYSRW